MPLTKLQINVLKTIAVNRGPDSYLAGATVQHMKKNSPRFSRDIDLFHDIADRVAECAESDAAVLARAGYKLEWLLRTTAFHRAVISKHSEHLRIEWAQDSAFRFFPLQEDPLCGFRLHDADAAVNKILALAGRQEARDFVDALHLDATYLPLGALVWAGCGKDPGFTPDLILDQASRHVAYTQDDIDRLSLRAPLDIRELKKQWLAASDRAQNLIAELPPEDVGCLYLDNDGKPASPNANSLGKLVRHYGSVGGAWPVVS
jgi:hypothetical protein